MGLYYLMVGYIFGFSVSNVCGLDMFGNVPLLKVWLGCVFGIHYCFAMVLAYVSVVWFGSMCLYHLMVVYGFGFGVSRVRGGR